MNVLGITFVVSPTNYLPYSLVCVLQLSLLIFNYFLIPILDSTVPVTGFLSSQQTFFHYSFTVILFPMKMSNPAWILFFGLGLGLTAVHTK